MNYRRFGRQLGVDHNTVMHWVKAQRDPLPNAPMPQAINNAEQDALVTFVGKKKTSST